MSSFARLARVKYLEVLRFCCVFAVGIPEESPRWSVFALVVDVINSVGVGECTNSYCG
jgi:hypothetical protein